MDLKVVCVVLGLSVYVLAGPAVDHSGSIENSVSETFHTLNIPLTAKSTGTCFRATHNS